LGQTKHLHADYNNRLFFKQISSKLEVFKFDFIRWVFTSTSDYI
jgi:hypothetical protein